MSRFKLVAILLLAAIILVLPSCGASPQPRDIVAALLENETAPPVGITYSTDARIGSPDYLSPELLKTTYGITDTFDGIVSASIHFTNTGRPCEFAVFHCKSRNDAEDVALFCRNRLDTLSRNAVSAAEFIGMTPEDYMRYIKNSAVIISGRWVSLIISSDTPAARRIIYKLL